MTSWLQKLLKPKPTAEVVVAPIRLSVSRQDSIGFLDEFGTFLPLFDRDPTRHIAELVTVADDQESMPVRLVAKAPDGDIRLLVHIRVRGIRAQPRGMAGFDLVLELKEHQDVSYRHSPSVELVITAKLQDADTDLPIDVLSQEE